MEAVLFTQHHESGRESEFQQSSCLLELRDEGPWQVLWELPRQHEADGPHWSLRTHCSTKLITYARTTVD